MVWTLFIIRFVGKHVIMDVNLLAIHIIEGYLFDRNPSFSPSYSTNSTTGVTLTLVGTHSNLMWRLHPYIKMK